MSISRSAAAIVESVVAALSKERVRQNVSKNRLAQMTGLSLTTISYFERGMRSPTFETVARVSLALGADLEALIRSALRASKTGKA